MVMPGDNTTITAELHVPVALEKGARYAIREGGRTVGAGHDYGNHSSRSDGHDTRTWQCSPTRSASA